LNFFLKKNNKNLILKNIYAEKERQLPRKQKIQFTSDRKIFDKNKFVSVVKWQLVLLEITLKSTAVHTFLFCCI